ncbi:MAG: iron-containing alcohol dehydrogenase [Chloroflexota bacterium]
MTNIPFYLGEQAIDELVRYCQARNLEHFFLIADRNTYPILGQAAEQALQAQGWDVRTLIYAAHDVVPDETFIVQALVQTDWVERMFLAVGSGVITDITRFVSHRTRRPFLSLPTAPSVDGFTSPSASLVLDGIKKTVVSQPPEAIFAHLPTLAAAPQAMIAAGYGDILGKAIALADWKLGNLLWDEPYSAAIAARVRQTLETCLAATDEIGQATPGGIEKLMNALVDSGLCMLDFGNSRPAAGAEHYMSHFLEMKFLAEGRPAVLHGAKVALCSLAVAELYDRLRQMTRAEMVERLRTIPLPDRDADIQRIRDIYGPIADSLVLEQAPFLNLTPHAYTQLKGRVLENWEDIQALAGGGGGAAGGGGGGRGGAPPGSRPPPPPPGRVARRTRPAWRCGRVKSNRPCAIPIFSATGLRFASWGACWVSKPDCKQRK